MCAPTQRPRRSAGAPSAGAGSSWPGRKWFPDNSLDFSSFCPSPCALAALSPPPDPSFFFSKVHCTCPASQADAPTLLRLFYHLRCAKRSPAELQYLRVTRASIEPLARTRGPAHTPQSVAMATPIFNARNIVRTRTHTRRKRRLRWWS